MLGQEDASLEMTLPPGDYEAQYDPGGAAGVIFYRLMTKDFAETKKMIQFGGKKSGGSRLTLISSGIRPRSQRSRTAAGYQANDFTVKLYTLPSTIPPIGETTIHITALTRDTTVTIYAAGAKGLPCPGTPDVAYAGRTYRTVQVGTQCWLKENLDVGTMIIGNVNATDNGIVEKYCQNNDTANCNTYGGLYLWSEAMQYNTAEGAQGICPSGWHIPRFAEFQQLTAAVGTDGNALKDTTQGTSWGKGTNRSGFSGLLAGRISPDPLGGEFKYFGTTAFFWSSTEAYGMDPQYLWLMDTSNDVGVALTGPDIGFSVRCIKN